MPDFAFGAMENWGIITFRETSLLVSDANDDVGDVAPGGPSTDQLYNVPLTVAHELAHMWFGALARRLCACKQASAAQSR